MDQLQNDQLVIALVHDRDEIQTGVSLVHDLVFLVVDEIAHLGFAGDHQLIDLYSVLSYLFQKPLLFLLRHVGRVPLGQPRATVAADQKEAMNHIKPVYLNYATVATNYILNHQIVVPIAVI